MLIPLDPEVFGEPKNSRGSRGHDLAMSNATGERAESSTGGSDASVAGQVPETDGDGEFTFDDVAVVMGTYNEEAAIGTVLEDIESVTDGRASVVCVDSVEMGRAVATVEPDQLLFERPGDIASDRAISRTHPDRIRAFLDMRDDVAPETKVRVGGGVSTAADVRRAFELGVDATGGASAIATADDPERRLREIGAVLADHE
mgnify:CR=1 FL=1